MFYNLFIFVFYYVLILFSIIGYGYFFLRLCKLDTRLEKFGYAKIIWKEEYEIMEKYLLYNIYIKNTTNSNPWKISEYILNVNGIHQIINKNYSSEIDIKLSDKGVSIDIDSFLKLVNSTKKNNGKYIQNKIDKKDNEYSITTNLIHDKKNPNKLNDPNTGFLVGIINTIKVLDPEAIFILTSLCGLNNTLINSKSKLWSCLKPFKDDIIIKNNDNEQIIKSWDIITTTPYEYIKECSGEKLSSMYLHRKFETNEDYEIMFHNHGGCERSFIKIKNKYYRSSPSNIPDLVIINWKKKEIYIIEAKLNDKHKIENGLKQLEKQIYWFNQNVVDKKLHGIEWNTFQPIKTYMCVYGNTKHPTYLKQKLLLSITSNGDRFYNKSEIEFN